MTVTEALEGLIALQFARVCLDGFLRAELGVSPMVVRDHRGKNWRRFDYRDEVADTILGEIEEDHDGQWIFACYPGEERHVENLVIFFTEDLTADVFDAFREQPSREPE